MLKILILSDSPTFNTGYSNTIRVIADAFLEAGCQVEQIAWGLYQETSYKYKLHPVKREDFFGKTIFTKVLDEYLPNVIFSFGDLLNTSWIANYPNRWFKWINYFPIDSDHLTVAQKHIIMQCDQPIVYSKTALNLIVGECKREETKIIYHGIDTNKFKTLNIDDIKRKYRLDGKFIVGYVGRNNTRKNIPALMEAFSDFAKDKDDAVLYLHTQAVDSHNLYEYIKMFNLSNKVYITKDMDMVGLSDEEMIELYTLIDVLTLPSKGEGMGLPILEAQACETPVLVTDFSACKEFVQKSMRVKVSDYYFEGSWDVKRALIDKKDLVDKLNNLYNNQNILPLIGENARRFVEGFDWKYIKPLWIYFIKLYAEQQFGIKDDTDDTLSKFIRI